LPESINLDVIVIVIHFNCDHLQQRSHRVRPWGVKVSDYCRLDNTQQERQFTSLEIHHWH
jgi:hypothetical protein